MPEEKTDQPEGGGELDLKAENERLQAELEKLKSKDLNFEKVRTMTEEEKKKHDGEKGALNSQIEELKGQIEANRQSQVSDWYDSVLDSAVGADEEKRKSVKAEYELLNLPATNREEVALRVKKALKLAGYELKGDTSSFTAMTGSRDSKREPAKRYSETEKGKATAKMFAPHLFKDDKK